MKKNSTPRRKERKNIIKQIGDNPGLAEMYKMRALNSLVEDLEDSIHKHSRSTCLLSVVLIIATLIVALTGIADIYYTTTFHGRNNLSQISGNLSK
jgi:hypothetical protein